MKILFFLRRSINGGAERVLTNIANLFAERNYDVILVISHDKEFTKNSYEINDKVKTVYLGIGNAFFAPIGTDNQTKLSQKIYWTRKTIKRLRENIIREKPDVVVAFLPIDILVMRLSTMFLKVPVVFSQRNAPNGSGYFKILTNLIFKFIYPTANGFVFQTQAVQSYFPEKLQRKSTVLRNLVDKQIFQTMQVQERHDIVCVGRLHPQKNWPLALEAFSRIADKVPDNFVFYGAGDELYALEQYVTQLNLVDRVRFAGNVSNVQEIVVNAKLFVLSSNHEGVPNALIEALILGVPCVTTRFDGGGAEFLIESGVNGTLVPKGDASALAQAMLRLLTDTDYAEQLAANAKLRACEEFHPDKVFEQWESYILSVVEKYNQGL